MIGFEISYDETDQIEFIRGTLSQNRQKSLDFFLFVQEQT